MLCLQETKTPDEHFPREAFAALGYAHMLVHGMKGYNGVAVLSRLPLDKHATPGWCERDGLPARRRRAARRHRAAQRLHPGRRRHSRSRRQRQVRPQAAASSTSSPRGSPSAEPTSRKIVLVGDLNIAPLETDVWSHKQLLTVVSHTPIEVEKLGKLQKAGGFVDAVRHFIPPERAALFLVELSQPRLGGLQSRPPARPYLGDAAAGRPRLAGAEVLSPVRGWERTSDHVPVVIRFDG